MARGPRHHGCAWPAFWGSVSQRPERVIKNRGHGRQTAALEGQNEIAIPYGAQAVSNYKRCPAPNKRAHGLHDRGFGDHIDRAGWLIQNEDR